MRQFFGRTSRKSARLVLTTLLSALRTQTQTVFSKSSLAAVPLALAFSILASNLQAQLGAPSEQGLVRMTNDGKSDDHPAWSPRGDSIVFTSTTAPNTGQFNDIWAISRDGTNLRQITSVVHDSFGGGLTFPAWLGSKGDLMVEDTNSIFDWLQLSLSANPPLPVVRSVFDGDSSNFTRLLYIPGGLGGGTLAASPDGSTLAWSARTTANAACPSMAHTDLHVSPVGSLSSQTATTSAGTIIVSNDLVCGSSGAEAMFGQAFSPDGSQIVVASAPDPNHFAFDLYIYKLDGTLVRRLTQSGGGTRRFVNWLPNWSTNNRITFASNSTGRFEIWTINADGTNLTQVTMNGGNWPTWSPDASRIAFASDRSGTSQIYAVPPPANSAGSTTFVVTGQPQPWVVPNNVTSITVDVRGAQGGSNSVEPPPRGGKGGRVQTTLAVTPGETLFIHVGGRGGDPIPPNTAGAGGFNGGGAGGIDNIDSNGPAGGGGGASDIRQGGDDLSNRAVVAGGGGGAECCVADSNGVGGDGGGTTGMLGGSNAISAAPGEGGTQTSGGTGGGGCNGAGNSGSLGQGGVGGNGNRAGGGGGGGYYGGGGGGGCTWGAGGGGGSSYSAGSDTIHATGYQSGDGQIVISFGTLTPPVSGLGSGGGTQNPVILYAEPVNTQNGNYFYLHTDLAMVGRGLPLRFQRSYNAIDSYAGPLGANWTHSYNTVLMQDGSGNAVIRWGDGHGETFTKNGTGYIAQRGVFSTLVAGPNETFVLTTKNLTSYIFSPTGRLMSTQDRNGNTVSLAYDGNANLTQVTDAVGRSFVLTHDGNNRITQVSDPIGRSVSFQYDANNNLVQSTDSSGGITQYAYDGSHHVQTITLPSAQMLLQNTYDASGRVVSQKNGRGFTTTFAYNTPNTGQTSITDPRGNTLIHSYDSAGRIVTIADPLSGTLNYAYDSQNDRAGITNQNGKTTSFIYDALGNVKSIADPLGNTATFTYDPNNNLLSAKNPKGNSTTFAYDLKGNLTTIVDAAGNTTKFGYDGFGELISKQDARGNTTAYSYDASGNLNKITDPLGKTTSLAYDGISRLLSVTDPNGHAAQATYDLLSRLVKVSDPLGNTTQFAYDPVGNLLKITDANVNSTSYGYDAVNNLATVTDAMGHVTTYGYDENNNRTSFRNGKGAITAYAFDALNRLTQITDPLSFVTAYSYDPVGNVIAKKDANGNLNRFVYDTLNRLSGIAYADGKSVAYAYDADSKRTSMTDAHGITAYSYDILDQLASVLNPNGKSVQYAYDAVGHRTALTYPDGKHVAYSYDPANRLSQVQDWLGRITGYSYDSANNLLKVAYPNQTSIQLAYDAANRLVQVQNLGRWDFMPLGKFTYQLDAVGNRLSVTNGLGFAKKYTYDPLYELTSVAKSFNDPDCDGPDDVVTKYAYDVVGNRSSLTRGKFTVPYTYDADDRLLKAGTATFTYDANGNQTSVSRSFSAQPSMYRYDATNRLISATGFLNSSFDYDGDGNRILQAVGKGAYNYVNDVATALPVVLQESGPDGSISYNYGLNLISETSSTFDFFYQFDGLGSVVGLTDSFGSLRARYDYDAWGQINPLMLNFVGEKNKFLFAGQALDPGTQDYYLRARYYDSREGRLLSRDLLPGRTIVPLSQNAYQYSLNNPLRYSDPSGLSALETGAVGGINPSTQLTASLISKFSDPNLAIKTFFEALANGLLNIGTLVKLKDLKNGIQEAQQNEDPQLQSVVSLCVSSAASGIGTLGGTVGSAYGCVLQQFPYLPPNITPDDLKKQIVQEAEREHVNLQP